jgi:hypothetical protein
MSQGLHDLGAERMSERLQREIDAVDATLYDAVLLGFGLCNNGIAGLRAQSLPLVVPRCHDCITLFLGSAARYRREFEAHPETYYLTTGWMERDESCAEGEQGVQERLGMERTYDDLVEEYGEENAAFVFEQLGDMTRHYSRLAYIEMRAYEENLRFRRLAEEMAEQRGWRFDALAGDLALLRQLLSGDWDEAFLIVQPGHEIAASYGDAIICARDHCARG